MALAGQSLAARVARVGPPRSLTRLSAVQPAAATQARPTNLLNWLEENGAPQPAVTLSTVQREGQQVDVTVAARALQPGDLALRVPERLVVTLDRVLQEDGLAELLTTNKLSELSILALYLCYEKKRGRESAWHAFIKELDRMAGRGPQGAKSLLLWSDEEVATYLAGSPVIGDIQERLRGIEKEYRELDTVWWMAGSLFRDYEFEASVVHLQGMPLGKRFALVPLGPPLLTYSSTAKAMLKYDAGSRQVQLAVDRPYAPGEPVLAWCGPQPNSKLLLNYGIVDEANTFDRLPLAITIPSSDSLYRLKRDRLAEAGLSTQQVFQLARRQPLPEQLLPYLRLVNAASEEEAWRVVFGAGAGPVSPANERLVLSQLIAHLRARLQQYRTTIAEDEATIADPASGPRATVAAKLVKIEKEILQQDLDLLMRLPGAAEAATLPPGASAIQLAGADGAICG
eukprot:scaffold12.g7961.t1